MKAKPSTGRKFSGFSLAICITLLTLTACGGDNTPQTQAGNSTSTTITVSEVTLEATTTNATLASASPAATVQVLGTIPPIADSTTAAAATTASAKVATTAASVTTVLPVGDAQRPNLADNNKLKTLSVDKQSSQKFASNLLGSNNQAANTQYFTTRDSFDNIMAYYDKVLAKDYKRAGQTSINNLGGELSGLKLPNGTVVGYQKQAQTGNSASNMAVINIGPVDKVFLEGLGKVSPDVAKQVAEGDRLIIVLYDVTTGLG